MLLFIVVESSQGFPQKIPAPSSFANTWYKDQRRFQSRGQLLLCHRPSDLNPHGCDVTLFYKGFDDFVKNSEVIELNDKDYNMAFNLCQEMGECYESESDRVEQLVKMLQEYFNFSGITFSHNVRNMDISLSVYDCPVAIVEVKNDVGHGKVDSYMEVIAYYVNELNYHKQGVNWQAPCFLIEIVGPHMMVSGAVVAKGVHVDRLIRPVWLVHQPYQKHAMICVARVMRALKVQLCDLVDLYIKAKAVEQPNYPFFQTPGDVGTLVYKKQIKPNVYVCLLNEKSKVVVKFVEGAYGIDVHKYLADQGYAPKVEYFNADLTSRYQVVVMQFIESAITLDDHIKDGSNPNDIVKECKVVIDDMHSKGYCHGDLRPNNILLNYINGQVKFNIIDFDWSGQANIKEYPGFMNSEIEWPEGASAGEKLKCEHDMYWLDKCLNTT